MAISENQITFYSGGGHNHDGVNKGSLIETSQYSIFDFSFGVFGDPDRARSQVLNAVALKEYIVSTVNSSVLQPAGIFLQSGTINGVTLIDNTVTADQIAANTITANEIAAFTITANEIEAFTITADQIAAGTITADQIEAGTITANELAANIVLINNIISSGNYVPNTSGWAINSDGTAEFASTSIRGDINADSLSIGPNDYWNADGEFLLGGVDGIFRNISGGITLGTNVTITGGVTASSVSIGANDYWSADGTFLLGGGNGIYSDGSGSITIGSDVSILGDLEASSLNTPGLKIFSDGAIESENFNVTVDGSIYATNAYFEGEIEGSTISGTSITVGGRISLPINGYEILLGSDWGGYVTQCYIYAGGEQGLFIDTSHSGSTFINGESMIINGNGFMHNRYIIGLQASVGGSIALRWLDGEVVRASSMRKLKDRISNFTNLDLIDQLMPKSFIWRPKISETDESESAKLQRESDVNIGFIAEEIAEIDGGRLGAYETNDEGVRVPSYYKTDDILALCVATIKDLRVSVKNLNAKVSLLEQRISGV